MANFDPSKRDSFGSKFGVIAAAAGSAVGLGNIWRFPYVAGENGGGAFIIIYLIFIIAIGVPVMLSEFTIGRSAQRNAFGSFKKLAPGTRWYLIGLMGVVAAFVILAFYSTVAGWTLEYIYLSVSDAFSGKGPDEITSIFEGFKSGTFRPIMWQLIFMVLTAWIVIAGVKNGIEKYAKILMPILLLLIIVLDIRAITLPKADLGLKFLFEPDFSKLNTKSILEALGQAFFSLSIGMGTLITYGSYIKKNENLTNTAIKVSAADTIIAILAGVAIFPAVFAFGIEPNAGPDLIFRTLPNIFQHIPGGYYFSLLFFILLAVAALTSSISVLEVVVAYFVEELGLVRKKATIVAASSIAIVGILATMSWGTLKGVKIFNYNIFELLDFSASSVFLPIGGLFIVLFLGWYVSKSRVKTEMSSQGLFKARLLPLFSVIIKFIAPIAIALVFLNGIGVINFKSEIKYQTVLKVEITADKTIQKEISIETIRDELNKGNWTVNIQRKKVNEELSEEQIDNLKTEDLDVNLYRMTVLEQSSQMNNKIIVKLDIFSKEPVPENISLDYFDNDIKKIDNKDSVKD